MLDHYLRIYLIVLSGTALFFVGLSAGLDAALDRYCKKRRITKTAHYIFAQGMDTLAYAKLLIRLKTRDTLGSRLADGLIIWRFSSQVVSALVVIFILLTLIDLAGTAGHPH